MDRRSFLRRISATGTVGLTGCQENGGQVNPPAQDGTEEPVPTESTVGRTTSTSPPEHESQADDRTDYHVGPDGRDAYEGSSEEPLASIHEALQRAVPGDTIRVAPGEYQEEHAPGEPLQTVRDGEQGAPITITGPEEAILYPNESGPALWIKNDHVRLQGLTIDGLLDSEDPDVEASYSRGNLIHCHPTHDSDEYLSNVVCAPAAIGNSHRPLMVFERTMHLEIGPLRVNGLAGAEYVVGGKENHVGEIIYLGQPPVRYDRERYPWSEIDRTRHVHIHHIDNSAGHPHSELVDAKFGTSDILIEYCTDGGGSQNNEEGTVSALHLACHDSTVRWNDLRNGQGRAIQIDAHNREWLREQDSSSVPPEKIATGNNIYGNEVSGFPEESLLFDFTNPGEQGVLCGNNFSSAYFRSHEEYRELDDNPSERCPENVPRSNGTGHLGGNSPWK